MMTASNLSSNSIPLLDLLSYKTQRKSAIPFGQRGCFNPYLTHYKPAFAFSSILYPPESSVLVTLDLLKVIDLF